MHWGFENEQLTDKQIATLKKLANQARGNILTMTTLASSGHPGGSMSSLDFYLILWSCANVYPNEPNNPIRDRIVISHGHTSPAVYSVLGALGFFDIDEAISTFRYAGSLFEGHTERNIQGIEWSTGNLGQGLSAACGFALAGRLLDREYNIFVPMGDGEQQKGQITEARRFAKKFKLNNITAIVDYNELQISGSIHNIMPQNIKANYESDGWKVLEIDGHNYQEIYYAMREATNDKETPYMIFAHTIMGKGISFMENLAKYHGVPLNYEQHKEAMKELGLEDKLGYYKKLRQHYEIKKLENTIAIDYPKIDIGTAKVYTKDTKIDNRSAFGNALYDLASINNNIPFAVFDCDLVPSVKPKKYKELRPDNFFQSGIQEHNTATIAGAISIEPIITFFADFGVFGVDETYNQQRLNDINFTNLNLITTHVGVDVGEDGKTHQCIDYIGLMRNLYGYKIIIPADANQTDRVIRYIATQEGNYYIPLGRSKTPVILDEDDNPFFIGDYKFNYAKADIIREGDDAVLIAIGTMLHRAVKVWEILQEGNIKIRIINLSCLSELDEEVLYNAISTGIIFTYEDHNINTGLGNILADWLVEKGLPCKLIKFGIKNYAPSGKTDDLFRMLKLDPESVAEHIANTLTA